MWEESRDIKYRDTQCLQTSLLLFNLNFANHRTKESFVSTANKPLVGTLMTISDVTVSIAITVALDFAINANNNFILLFEFSKLLTFIVFVG